MKSTAVKRVSNSMLQLPDVDERNRSSTSLPNLLKRVSKKDKTKAWLLRKMSKKGASASENNLYITADNDCVDVQTAGGDMSAKVANNGSMKNGQLRNSKGQNRSGVRGDVAQVPLNDAGTPFNWSENKEKVGENTIKQTINKSVNSLEDSADTDATTDVEGRLDVDCVGVEDLRRSSQLSGRSRLSVRGVKEWSKRRGKSPSPSLLVSSETQNGNIEPFSRNESKRGAELAQNVGFGKVALNASVHSERTMLSLKSMKINRGASRGSSLSPAPGRSFHSRTKSASSTATAGTRSLLDSSYSLDDVKGTHIPVLNNVAEIVDEQVIENGKICDSENFNRHVSTTKDLTEEVDWVFRAAIVFMTLAVFLGMLSVVGIKVFPQANLEEITSLKRQWFGARSMFQNSYEVHNSENWRRRLQANIKEVRENQEKLIREQFSPFVSINMILKDEDSFGKGRGLIDTLLLIKSLKYPSDKLSFNVLISDHEFYKYALKLVNDMLPHFHSVGVIHKDLGWTTGKSDKERHAPGVQRKRRGMLAKYRNILYFATRYNNYVDLKNSVNITTNRRMKPSHYVLWLDADVEYFTPSLLTDLIGSGKYIITPRCLREGIDYDLNTWAGDRVEASHPTQYRHALFVPYPAIGNRNMKHFAEEGKDYVRVDSVGGTVLLIRSDIHDQGVMFPPYPVVGVHESTLGGYDGIETEGLCYIARAAGVACWGAPYIVIHHNYYD
eukprot:CFRG5166T1